LGFKQGNHLSPIYHQTSAALTFLSSSVSGILVSRGRPSTVFTYEHNSHG
jgi:hypothetical protein